MREYSDEEKKLVTRVLPGVAQELRGAMANIYIAAENLVPAETRERNEKTDQYAAAFTQSYYRINRVLTNLGDAAELAESGRYGGLLNDDIVGLARTVCTKAEGLFAGEGVTLTFMSDKPGQLIAMDAARMERLLFNLLSNALKFTPRGGTVSVRVRVTKPSVLLSVSDTGCGIAPDRLERVFESFLEQDPMRLPPRGMGLGLALCRRIAEGHGGSIVAESKEGKGSRFTVSLPNRRSDILVVREDRFHYGSAFNPTLLELADALSAKAFTVRRMD